MLQARLDAIRNAMQNLPAGLGPHPRPGGEGLLRGGDGSISLGLTPPGHLPEHGAVDGGEVLEGVD